MDFHGAFVATGVAIGHHQLEVGAGLGEWLWGARQCARTIIDFLTSQNRFLYHDCHCRFLLSLALVR